MSTAGGLLREASKVSGPGAGTPATARMTMHEHTKEKRRTERKKKEQKKGKRERGRRTEENNRHTFIAPSLYIYAYIF